MDFLPAGAEFVPDSVGRRDADGEHVGFVSLSEPLVPEGCFGHVKGHGDALDVGFEVESRCRLVGFVELFHPGGQLLHVIRARNEVSGACVPPISCVGTVAGWQDGGAVFERHSNDLCAEIGGEFQLIADG